MASTTLWTAVAGVVFGAYALLAPADLRGGLVWYALAATVLVAVALAAHGALAVRLGSLTALAALAVAVFITTTVVSYGADACAVGRVGRCRPVDAAATGFAAMLLPLVVFVVHRLGASTFRLGIALGRRVRAGLVWLWTRPPRTRGPKRRAGRQAQRGAGRSR